MMDCCMHEGCIACEHEWDGGSRTLSIRGGCHTRVLRPINKKREKEHTHTHIHTKKNQPATRTHMHKKQTPLGMRTKRVKRIEGKPTQKTNAHITKTTSASRAFHAAQLFSPSSCYGCCFGGCFELGVFLISWVGVKVSVMVDLGWVMVFSYFTVINWWINCDNEWNDELIDIHW